MGSIIKKINRKILLSVVKNFAVKSSHLHVGDTVSRTRKITKSDIDQFSSISVDRNIIHTEFNDKPVVHGAFLNALVSGVIGSELPGNGTLVLKQTLNFPHKCYCDDIVTTTVEIVKLRKIIEVAFRCVVEDKVVLYGDAKLILNR